LPKSWFVFVFRFFLYLFFRRHLGRVLYKTQSLEGLNDPNLPVILLANHLSWWDGFLIIFLAEKLMPKRELNIAMLQSEWAKRKWMSYIGAVPIDPSSPAQLLSFFKKLTKRKSDLPPICLAYFFEGRMASPAENAPPPKRGAELIIQKLSPVIVLPVSIVMDYRFNSKTSAFVNVASPKVIENPEQLPEVYFKIKSLHQMTVQDTTETQEYSERLSQKGWSILW